MSSRKAIETRRLAARHSVSTLGQNRVSSRKAIETRLRLPASARSPSQNRVSSRKAIETSAMPNVIPPVSRRQNRVSSRKAIETSVQGQVNAALAEKSESGEQPKGD